MNEILIMKTGQTIPAVAAAYGDFEDWIITGSGLTAGAFRTVSVFAGEQLPAGEAIDGVIITGSPAMVTDDETWIRQAEEFLRHAINKDIPILGICFGHQLLAQALGGRVDYHPGGREIGTTQVELAENAGNDPLFGGLPAGFAVHVTHMQAVLALPSAAEILAGNDFDPHQGVRFAPQAWGVQFHPEFDANIITAYLRERREQLIAEGLDAERLLAEVTEAEAAAGLLPRFVDLCRRSRND